jgi:antitoxin component of MazEF toxin-antitoxin module
LTGFSTEAILSISNGGANMVTKVQKWGNSQGLRLQELVSRIPKNYETGEIDWGEPVGREAW